MEIGALWKRKSGDGKSFLSGVIEFPGINIPVAIFPNENKKADNHPDFKVVWSKPQEKKQESNNSFSGEANPFA